jgi:hypothetical protein
MADICLFHGITYTSTNLTTISTPRNTASGSLPALPHNYRILLYVTHVYGLSLYLHFWLLPHHKPTYVTEKEAPV